MLNIKEILGYQLKIKLFAVVSFIVAISLSVQVGFVVKSKIQCGKVVSQYEETISVVSQLDVEARNKWDSFPLYEGGFGGDARDPNGGGGRIYGSFEDYFNENYGSASDSEMRISQLLIVQNPSCFTPREVAEAQDYLDLFK
jgi:hypothetical protein